MLRMGEIFPFLLLLCSALAMEEINNLNQIESSDPSEDAEGRACGSCGGGTGTTTKPTITIGKPDLGNILGGNDLLTLLFGSLGSLAVLVFNILGIVLLALLLKNLLSDSKGGAATDPYYYASQSSYADPLTYNKRSSVGASSWSLQAIQDSPIVTFLTQFVTDAIDKHNIIEKQ